MELSINLIQKHLFVKRETHTRSSGVDAARARVCVCVCVSALCRLKAGSALVKRSCITWLAGSQRCFAAVTNIIRCALRFVRSAVLSFQWLRNAVRFILASSFRPCLLCIPSFFRSIISKGVALTSFSTSGRHGRPFLRSGIGSLILIYRHGAFCWSMDTEFNRNLR